MIGLTNLTGNGRRPLLPKLNRRRALFVLAKIDEILAWDKNAQLERDAKFVDLGRYLCEVRAGQYWRLDKLKSFDEFLERKFPESRRKAYYLMAIHEQLPTESCINNVLYEVKKGGSSGRRSGGVGECFGRAGRGGARFWPSSARRVRPGWPEGSA